MRNWTYTQKWQKPVKQTISCRAFECLLHGRGDEKSLESGKSVVIGKNRQVLLAFNWGFPGFSPL